MVIAEITVVIKSIKAALNIAKGMKSLNDTVVRNESVSKLLDTLISLQMQALEVQSQAQALDIENFEMKRKLLEAEDWKKTEENYKLKDLGANVYVYAYNKEGDSREPMHYLCPNCFSDKKKSILQCKDVYDAEVLYDCLACKSEIRYNSNKETSDASDPNWQDFEPI
jgi:hypothetical protein